jgi:hypothetical protein
MHFWQENTLYMMECMNVTRKCGCNTVHIARFVLLLKGFTSQLSFQWSAVDMHLEKFVCKIQCSLESSWRVIGVNYAYVSILALLINFVSENILCEVLGMHCGQDYLSVTDLP